MRTASSTDSSPRWSSASTRTPPISQDVHRIIADGEYAVAEWTSHARSRYGRTYENDYAVVFHVVDGQIGAVTEYLDTAYMKQVLFED